MDRKAKIEAALFVADRPLSVEDLSKIIGGDPEDVLKTVASLADDCGKEDRGIELVETPEGYEFRIKQQYRDNVASLAPFSDLGEGMLRTLAIIAAKQPIKQSVIVAYQGNKVYDYVNNLEAKGLIKTERFGRTKLITTTAGFEKYFGKSVEDVKRTLNVKFGDKDKEIEKTASDKLPGEKSKRL